jgi:hypothetical protein
MRTGLSCLVAAAACVAEAACAPDVQRASLTPASPEVRAEAAAIAEAHPRRLAFRSPAARVHVFASDLVNGDHHLEFEQVRGSWLVAPGGRGHLHVDVAMQHFHAESGFITGFASDMLETASHPHTVIDATVEPIDGEPTQRLVVGNIVLHGVERGIRFRAEVTPSGDGLRLHATFDMARSAFGIHARPEDGEGIIRDDFTVTFDFRATPEHVTVEE